MIFSNDISKRCEEIQLLIAEDNIPQATKRLMDFVRDFSQDREDLNEIVIMSASYNRLRRKERGNLLNYDEIERKRNQILMSMLGFLDDFRDRLSFQKGFA